MKRLVAYVILSGCFALGCGGKPPVKPVVKKPVPGKIGAACKPSAGSDGWTQGNCDKGLVCNTAVPGGYCTANCPCGAGGTCAESSSAPEMCLKSCSSDSDCRAKDGYVCDAAQKVCTVPGWTAVKAPACEPPAPPLQRKAFGKVVQLSSSKASGKYNLGPAAAQAKNGDLIAVYVAGNEAGSALAASRVVDDLAVEGGELKLDKNYHSNVSIAADRNGKLYIAYLAYDGGVPGKNMMVGVASSDDGINWSKGVVANDAKDCAGNAPGCLENPIIAIGPDRTNAKLDTIYVFYASTTSKGLMVTHSSDNGATFTPSTSVGDGTVADILVTKSKVHVVYVGGGGNKMGDAANGVYYTNSADSGATFAAPVRVSGASESVPQYFASPQLLADLNSGTLYTIYPVGSADGQWDILLASSKDGGGNWARALVNDDTHCASHMAPTATLDATGKIHIVWLDNRSGKGSLAYANCAPGGNKCTPNEAVNDTPFASYGFGRYTSRWLGDHNAVVVDLKKKLLHSVWTQTVDENGTPTSRIFTSSSKLGK